jgi:hypothetical protein
MFIGTQVSNLYTAAINRTIIDRALTYFHYMFVEHKPVLSP